MEKNMTKTILNERVTRAGDCACGHGTRDHQNTDDSETERGCCGANHDQASERSHGDCCGGHEAAGQVRSDNPDESVAGGRQS